VRREVVAVSERCPKCGANASDHVALANPGIVDPREWECGTYRTLATGEIVESEDCLRNQLAQAQERAETAEARIEELEHEVRQLRGILAAYHIVPIE